jgi:predicted oxidoreductase (fatty acid repression mutant protein)
MVKEILQQAISAEAYVATEKKLDGFRAGYGTVSSVDFFDSQTIIKDFC